jgi:hypothetical protein
MSRTGACSPTQVSTRLKVLHAFLQYLVDREVVPPHLLKRKLRIKVPEALPRAMDPEDVRQFLTMIEKPRDRAMILVLLRTGMHIGELLATRISEVNLGEKQIIIGEAPKTGVGRVAYLSEDASKALTVWMERRDPAKQRLFYGQGRPRLSYTAVRVRLAKYLEAAGLAHKGYSLHLPRPALEVAQIFCHHGPDYRKNQRLTPGQHKAMRDIERCRTARLGGHVDSCSLGCGYLAISYNSCRNRHCPKCQSLQQAKWLAERLERLLPTHYFHLVVTLPHELNPLALHSPELVFNLLFASVSQALQQFAQDYEPL